MAMTRETTSDGSYAKLLQLEKASEAYKQATG